MCVPWGSFLVDQRGKTYSKPGVLSHSDLMREFGFGNFDETNPGNRNHIWRPEYNWLDRTLEDFDRLKPILNTTFSKTLQPTQLACKAVDSFVEKNFSDANKFLNWLGEGNWIKGHESKYSRLLTSADKFKETKRCAHFLDRNISFEISILVFILLIISSFITSITS